MLTRPHAGTEASVVAVLPKAISGQCTRSQKHKHTSTAALVLVKGPKAKVNSSDPWG